MTGAPGWSTWQVGQRVVVRRRLHDVPAGEPGHTDVLGELVASDATGVTVRTRSGDVRVPAQDIALGKVVPPAPVRRVSPRPPEPRRR